MIGVNEELVQNYLDDCRENLDAMETELLAVSDHLKTQFFEHPPRLDQYPLLFFRGCGSV